MDNIKHKFKNFIVFIKSDITLGIWALNFIRLPHVLMKLKSVFIKVLAKKLSTAMCKIYNFEYVTYTCT